MGFTASIICSIIPAGAVGSLSLPSPLLPAAASNAAPFVTGAALQTLLARLVQVGTWEGEDFNGYFLVPPPIVGIDKEEEGRIGI